MTDTLDFIEWHQPEHHYISRIIEENEKTIDRHSDREHALMQNVECIEADVFSKENEIARLR